jgi:PPP family 3-phenylpropionic acid transporter
VYLPYFPLYLAHLGFRGAQIGLVVGLQPALRYVSSIGWSYAADRWRIRHRLQVLTGLGGALLFVPLLAVHEFRAVLVVMTGIALLHGTLVPMLDATVVDHVADLGGDYGRLRVWGSIGFIAGALLSALLVRLLSSAVIPWLLLVAGIGLTPALVGLPRGQLGHPQDFRAPWALLSPPMTAFLATTFLVQASCGAWAGFFAAHTRSLGLSDAVPGIAFSVAVVAEVGLMVWNRRLVDWISPQVLIAAALGVTILRWAGTAIARDETAVVLFQLGHTFTFSVFHLAALRMLARLVPPESTTGGQALYGLVGFGMGGSMGLWMAGALVDRLGTSGLFGFEAVVAGIGLLPALRLLQLGRRDGGTT